MSDMTFEQALTEMKNGRKVKHKSWDNTYIWIEKKYGKYAVMQHVRRGIADVRDGVPAEWVMMDNWEIVEN